MFFRAPDVTNQGLFLCCFSIPIELDEKLIESKRTPDKLKNEKGCIPQDKSIIAQDVSPYEIKHLISQ